MGGGRAWRPSWTCSSASWPPRRSASRRPNGPWWRPWRSVTSCAGCSVPIRPKPPGSAAPKTPAWRSTTTGPGTCSGRRHATWPRPRPRWPPTSRPCWGCSSDDPRRTCRHGERNPAPDADMMAPALDDGLMHDGNTGVTCPTCGGTAGAADSFCESCGTELAPPVSSAGPPGYTAQCPVCSLDDSAEPGAISAEGYCESCGRKVPSGRDHVELNLELLAGVTDRGLRHPRNEDAMALATTETPAGPVAIAVVCDGVSSSPNPEDASLTGAQAAVRMLLSSIRRGDDPDEASVAAVRQAHEAMAILGSPSRAPSATYVSAIVAQEAVTVCWLGDSRAYWLATESESARLTKDDSLAEELVAQGQMTEAEAMAILGSPSRAPSATYVSAIVAQEAVTVCWLGDSRAYWLATESESARLTKDDSLAEELVAQGQMTEAEAMASPQAHVITRWLGA